MKILVTGAAGYIGSVLCKKLLDNNYTVTGIDNFMYGNQQAILSLLTYPKFKVMRGDVRKQHILSGLSQYDVIIPLAAIVGAPACDKKPLDAMQINYHSIADLVSRLNKDQRIIYPNTNSGYGIQSEGECTEESPLEPISVYGKSKCEAEKAVLQHPNCVALRLATVCGVSPRMRFDLMVNDFTSQIYDCLWWRQKELKIFEPNYRRNFVHIQDVARAFCHMVGRYDLKGVYNVGNPAANMSKLELVHKIADLLDCYPRDFIKIGEGEDPDKRNYVVSNEKILRTGFEFKHSIEQGILEAANINYLTTPEQRKLMSNV